MQNLSSEAQFFHDISSKIIDFVQNYEGKPQIGTTKEEGDYATEIDLTVEEMIVSEIQARFPDDAILAEEGHSDTPIPTARIWIIDPICGTFNLRRELSNFCTNIALADNGDLVASCVIDHSHGEYFWSVGEQKVYINDNLWTLPELKEGEVNAIDVNLGALGNLPREARRTHATFVDTLLSNTDYYLESMGTSLAFAYAAIGKLDGFISPYDKTWDIAAASFLMQQAGGTITQTSGESWQLQPIIGSIGSLYPEIHQRLLDSAQTAGY